MIFYHLLRSATPVRKLPGIFLCIDVVLYMLNVSAALKQDNLQALFAKFLGRPAATDAAANDDSIITVLSSRFCIYIE